MPGQNIHLLQEPQAEHLKHLKAKLYPEIRLTTGDEVPDDAHVLVAARPSRVHLSGKPLLDTLIIPHAGLPPETAALLREFERIKAYNLHHNAPMTAEMAVGLLLAAAKSIIPADRHLRQHNWSGRYDGLPYAVLENKTALILGYGEVGRHVGRICWAFGMKVMAIRRTITGKALPLVEIGGPERLHEWLPRAQVLIICLPGTPHTAGMIGERELALLPPNAILVNVGRADVVDQSALYAALKNRQLLAAGLDVWYRYPADAAARSHTPPSDYPFHELDNVVMSPHRGGGGGNDEVELRRMNALANSLNAAASDEPIPHPVSLEAGY